jgi:hypothetical protein
MRARISVSRQPVFDAMLPPGALARHGRHHP